MATEEERLAWEQALIDAVEHMYAHGCPCAFPRFRQYASFDFRREGASPTRCHETEALIALVFHQRDGAWTTEGDDRICSVCGSRVELCYDDFSITMWRTTAVWRDDRAVVVGAAIEGAAPVRAGLVYLVDYGPGACAERFRDAGVEELREYLFGMGD